jgi:hypothetical protein
MKSRKVITISCWDLFISLFIPFLIIVLSRGDSMTRSPLSIIADGVLHHLPTRVLQSFDNAPTKALRKLKRNRLLVQAMAKVQVESAMRNMESDKELGKDVLSQIGLWIHILA